MVIDYVKQLKIEVNLSSIFNFLNNGSNFIENGIIYTENKAVGVINPSLLEGKDQDNNTYISITKGIVKIHDLTNEGVWRSLIESGSIIFGTNEDEVFETKKYLDSPETSRTSSYLLSLVNNCKDFNTAIKKIQESNILIIGCGGIGSLTAILLAGIGIKKITLVDNDFIEKSNLNRQILWKQTDLGHLKTEVLRRELNARYDNIECTILNEKYINTAKIQNIFDSIIVTADEPLNLGEQLIENNPSIDPSSFIISGYVHHYLTYQTGDYKLLNHIDTSIQWSRNPFFIGPSFGPSNIELAGVISALAINKIGFGLKKEIASCWSSLSFPRESIHV